jgi:hypothetical protein
MVDPVIYIVAPGQAVPCTGIDPKCRIVTIVKWPATCSKRPGLERLTSSKKIQVR